MDRFIVCLPSLLFVLVSYLKSSLDRFIGKGKNNDRETNAYLKSSLDRFIATLLEEQASAMGNLKSSLDRFIGGERVTFE